MFYISSMVQSVGYNPYYQNYYPYEDYPYEPRRTAPQKQESSEISALGLLLASEAIRYGSEKASNALMRGKEYTTIDNVKKVTQNMLNKGNLNDVSVHFVDMNNIQNISRKTGISVNNLYEVASGKNAFYADSAKVAVAPKAKPSLIQHELGHAINAKNPFLKALQNSRRYAHFAPTALILANAIAKRINKDPNGEPTFIEKHAGKLGFAAFLPTIIEEGIASLRGIQAAKRTLGGQNIKLGALKRNYFFAWMTYLLAGLGLGVAAKLSVKTGIPINS